MTPTQPIIAIDRITKRFPGVVALDDVTFEIARGEFHAIVGENGAGKSTLMKILAGVITEFEGELRLRGRPVRFRGPRDAEAAGVAIIHQELNLVDELTAAANIFLGRERRTRLGFLDDRGMERQAAALFAELECDIRPDRPVRALRVGDQQLVEIAKALSLQAGILIMDEPTSALTDSEVERLFRIVERLLDRGVTILYISHKLDEVFRLSDRITVLRDGKRVATFDRSETSPREVVHLMVGREIESAWQRGRPVGQASNLPASAAIGEQDDGLTHSVGVPASPAVQSGRLETCPTTDRPLLEVEGLSLPWTGHARNWRLRNIGFSLFPGEVLGIAGLMGAGRTELLECLFGTSPEPPLGRIRLAGRDVRFEHPADAMRAGVALVTEDRKRLGLFDHLTVRDNITVCTLSEAATAGLVSSRRERQLAQSSVGLLGIRTPGTEAAVSSLSGGNQQKCIIARWLRTGPKVLLLDDPTRGIDVGAKAEIYKVIDELCRKGLGIILTSSELPELITLCDRILVLCEGRLTGELTRDEFSEQAIMEAATRREQVGALLPDRSQHI